MTKRGWRRAALAAVGLLLLLAAGWAVSRARCFAVGGESICRIETKRKLVALTLDDGPTEAGVAATLPILARHGAKATFFLIGKEAEQRPHLVRRIAASGHEIANHSYSHQWMIARTDAWNDAEIGRTHRALMAAGAPPPRLFRPPYGKKLWGLPAALRRHGYRMIMIDVEEPTADDPRLC